MARRPLIRGGALILDSEGLVRLSAGDARAVAYVKAAIVRRASVVVSAVTLAEVLRGGQRDAAVHRVLADVSVTPVTQGLGRRAGELLGETRLSGNRCTIDAVVAATALAAGRPAVVLTSDPDDLNRLVEEPGRVKHERVAVVEV